MNRRNHLFRKLFIIIMLFVFPVFPFLNGLNKLSSPFLFLNKQNTPSVIYAKASEDTSYKVEKEL